MEIKIWDREKREYIDKKNISDIYISPNKKYFKIDGIIYPTSMFNLQFIHNGA